MIVDSIIEQIEAGRAGHNHGIPMGLPKLESIIDGVTRETYTVIMSNSGAGKTSFALFAYVYRPLMLHLDDDNFKILFFSLEMNEVSLYVKLLALYIFETYGIELSFKKILSREKHYTLSDEYYELIQRCTPWLEKVSKKLEIYDKNINANKVYAILKTRLEEIGTFHETETRWTYTPNNPNLVYNVVIDHIGLIKPSTGNTLKQEMDLLSSYLVTLREKCGISPVVIQQANRDQGNIERFKQGKSAFTINDTKDSGNMVQDCNIMLALYNPNRDNLKNYRKYCIDQLGNNYRSLMVLKNRFGDCDVEVGLNFFGGINCFAELPKPDEIYDYSKYLSPYWIYEEIHKNKDELNNIDEEKELDNSNNVNNFIL